MALPDSKDASHYKVHGTDPINAEPETEPLVADSNWTTPQSLQYMRNHGELLSLPKEGYRVLLDVESNLRIYFDTAAPLVQERLAQALDLDTLISLGKVNLAAALQCAGNRREEMNERKPVEGIQWEAGSILNADWEGVLLRKVLLALGLPEDFATKPALANAHVHFFSQQQCQEADNYEASIPLKDAMDESRSVLLADTMNGQSLPDEHGGPLRVVVPGFIGARSVKWLHTLRIKSEPSTNYYMTSDYKKLPSHVGSGEKAEWMKKVGPLQETGLQSSIGNATQTAEGVSVEGYAFDGAGSAIASVEVCALFDSQKLSEEDLITDSLKREWTLASLNQEQKKEGEKTWSWTLFSVILPVQEAWKGQELAFMCRAKTEDGREQEKLGQWNIRGVGETSYGQCRHFRCE